MHVLSSVLDLVYPRLCAVCGDTVTRDNAHVCWDCFAQFMVISDPFCRKCGDPVDGMVEHRYTCSVCERAEPHFDLARSAVRYRGSGKSLIHSFKYNTMTSVSGDMVELLLACADTFYSDREFDAVTYVPLHSSRERVRTYNQSRLLAAGLARKMKLPLLANSLRRVRMTATQTGLKVSGRKKNVKGAFDVSKSDWVRGRRLLLVDDVMTTGATVNECSRVLKESGAGGVCVITVARG